MIRLPLTLIVLAASAGAAAETFDHAGALGLLVAGSADDRLATRTDATATDNGFRAGVELGGTWALSQHKEAKLSVRLFPAGAGTSVGVMGGLRNGYQMDRWRTFFDLELATYLGSVVTVGPHLGLGLQYELHPMVGVYAELATHFGLGNGARFVAEIVLGFQFRSYLLN